MSEHRYVALLRGINVGGNNPIKMLDLKASFEELGFASVKTYIQSGNVVFAAKTKGKAEKLIEQIETALSARFSYSSRIVLLSAEELATVVKEAPRGFGRQAEKYRYDVWFVKAPLTTRQAYADIPRHPEVDVGFVGKHALYFKREIARATQSRLARVTQLPIYRSVTIRNWNTTTKLLALAMA